MSKSEENAIRLDLFEWRVERLEVANLSLINRASSLVGFVVVEFGLVAQVLTITSGPLNKFSKYFLEVGITFLVLTLLFLLLSIISTGDSQSYIFNEEVNKLDSDELIAYFTKLPEGYRESIDETSKSIKFKKKNKLFDFKFNEEAIAYHENSRRHFPYILGMLSLFIAQLMIALSLLNYIIKK